MRSEEAVATITLDTLLEFRAAPDFVKIDVEGAERWVLEGGPNLLRNIRPVIYVEVTAPSRDWVTAELRRNGYVLFDGSQHKSIRKEIQTCAFNTLAVPT